MFNGNGDRRWNTYRITNKTLFARWYYSDTLMLDHVLFIHKILEYTIVMLSCKVKVILRLFVILKCLLCENKRVTSKSTLELNLILEIIL